jgi:CheY-like chemotaxis protein
LAVWLAAWSRGIAELRQIRGRNVDLRRKLEKERSLEAIDPRLRAMVENAPLAMLLFDDEGRVLHGNRAAHGTLDLARRAAPDVFFADLLSSGATAKFADVRQLLDDAGPKTLSLSLRAGSGRVFEARAHLALTPQEKGAPALVAMMFEPPAPAAADAGPAAAAAKLVLVADDEELQRFLIKTMLERMGYEAVLAAGGRQALEIFAAQRERIVAAVLDVSMPGVSGEEAAARLRETAPNLPILFCSGFVEGSSDAPTTGRGRFLGKPFGFEDFKIAFRSVMAPDAGRGA